MSPSPDLRQRQADFERQAMPHSPSLLRAARRLSFDAVLAEDLTQEALLKAWRSFDQFEQGSNIRAWLFRILFNTYYAHGRSQRARPVYFSYEAIAVSRPSVAPEPSRAENHQISGLDVASALAALSEEHRTVLSLVVMEGFTCREASEILSLPMGTVMSRIARAREALREFLAMPPGHHRALVSAAVAGRQP